MGHGCRKVEALLKSIANFDRANVQFRSAKRFKHCSLHVLTPVIGNRVASCACGKEHLSPSACFGETEGALAMKGDMVHVFLQLGSFVAIEATTFIHMPSSVQLITNRTVDVRCACLKRG